LEKQVFVMATSSKTSIIAADQHLVSGLQKHQAAISTFLIDGKPVTVPAAVAVLQGRINASQAVDPARAAFHVAVQADRDERAQTKSFVSQLTHQIVLLYTYDPVILADYGLVPRKTAVKSPTVKVVAAVKMRATRKARGTKGPKARKAVKGAIPATISIAVPAPVPVPVEPAPAAANANPVTAGNGAVLPASGK
jgi:hypothetical protein